MYRWDMIDTFTLKAFSLKPCWRFSNMSRHIPRRHRTNNIRRFWRQRSSRFPEWHRWHSRFYPLPAVCAMIAEPSPGFRWISFSDNHVNVFATGKLLIDDTGWNENGERAQNFCLSGTGKPSAQALQARGSFGWGAAWRFVWTFGMRFAWHEIFNVILYWR